DERAKLRKVIVERAEQFWRRLNPFRGNEFNNHAWLQTLALAEAGFVLIGEHEEAAAWAEFSRQLYLGRFLCGLGYQGDNNEGIGYWGYGLGFVIDYGDLMRHVCGIDLFQHPWLNQTARFPMYCAPPGAWAVSFADTGKPNHGVRGPAEQRQVRDLAIRTRDPYALWYAGATNAVDGLAPKPPTDLPQSIHYRHIGWVIFNTSLADGLVNSTFAMRSGPFYASHQHDDQNGFVIHAYGEKLAIDSGYYDWWGSPHFKGYSTLTRAHNTILVNGKDQAHMQKGADGRIAAYYDSPAYGYTVGDASNPAVYLGQLKRFDRRALFIKPGFVVIHDLLQSSAAPTCYDWLLHAVAPIETDTASQSFALTSGRAALRGRFLSPPKLAMAVTKGYPVEPVDGYSTRPVPPEKYAHEWTLAAARNAPAENEDFVTAMQIRRLAPAAEPEARLESLKAANAFGVRITAGNDTHIILFRQRDAKGAIDGGDLDSDGEAAAVCFDAQRGVLRSAFAAGATWLRFRGRELFRSATPKDWSLPPASKP
ncbi:MAG: heparinase II/III family protein, partial [Verrucomicrobiae bacterium]|nr:heparinase II/III family protein [Verrucomicrobiae bacterium]